MASMRRTFAGKLPRGQGDLIFRAGNPGLVMVLYPGRQSSYKAVSASSGCGMLVEMTVYRYPSTASCRGEVAHAWVVFRRWEPGIAQ